MEQMTDHIDFALRQKINQLFENGVWKSFDVPAFSVERPKDFSHGDYTVNLGFVLAQFVGEGPFVISGQIADALDIEGVETVVAVGGYINFTLTQHVKVQILQDIVHGEHSYLVHTGQKILIEHTSPNLFKPFHIGHLVNNTIGESIVRLVESTGAQTVRVSYPSDMSLGIAKAVWAAREDRSVLLGNDVDIYEKMQFLGMCYVRGTKAYDEDSVAQGDIRSINRAIYTSEKTLDTDVYEAGKALSLAYLKDMAKLLGSSFDHFFFESQAGIEGQNIVNENIGTVFEKSEGAIVYKGERDGLHTRVFLNKEGLPTYESKDIGLLALKFAQYKPDQSIIVTDAEQSEYYKVVLAAAARINNDWSEKTVHITHGRLQFSGIKISSRLGNVPLAEDIIANIISKVENKVKTSFESRDIDPATMQSIAIGAIKFAILKVSVGKNIIFETEDALSFEGDSGPYLQYTYARTSSILRKAQEASPPHGDHQHAFDHDMGELVYLLSIAEEIMYNSAEKKAPHYIANHLLEVAHAYNRYYAQHKIIDQDSEHSSTRIFLTEATNAVLKRGLSVLGIDALEVM